MSDPVYLTPADVARLCGVTPAAVRKWERLGRLRCIRTAGGARLFERADVEALRAARQSPDQSTPHEEHPQ